MISHLFAALTREISYSTCTLSTLLTALNISIQTIVAIICKTVMFLEIYVFGERVIGWVCGGGGGVRNISSPLRGVLNIFRRFWGSAKFYGRILEYPPPPQYTYFMTGPLMKGKNASALKGEKQRYKRIEQYYYNPPK